MILAKNSSSCGVGVNLTIIDATVTSPVNAADISTQFSKSQSMSLPPYFYSQGACYAGDKPTNNRDSLVKPFALVELIKPVFALHKLSLTRAISNAFSPVKIGQYFVQRILPLFFRQVLAPFFPIRHTRHFPFSVFLRSSSFRITQLQIHLFLNMQSFLQNAQINKLNEI